MQVIQNSTVVQPRINLGYGGGQTTPFPFVRAMMDTERKIPGTNLVFKILTNQDDIDEAYRLRYQTFCFETKIADPAKFLDGKESDEYDDGGCLHTAITEDDRIVAYTRLVLPCDEFPIERSNILPPSFDRERSIEVSRALLVKDKRGPGNLIWHLFNNIYALCQDDDVDAILSFSTQIMFNGYRKRRVPFRHTGTPVNFHGHTGFPLIIDVDNSRVPNFMLH
jgi:N-acyl-L-homoserine lactone synthetase